jgi:hypothetical protein
MMNTDLKTDLKTDDKTPVIPMDMRLSARKGPPPGRPAGSISIPEMVRGITDEVRRASLSELEERTIAIQTSLRSELRSVSLVVVAALTVNAAAAVALLMAAHVSPGRSVGIVVLAVAGAALARALTRSTPSTSSGWTPSRGDRTAALPHRS